MIAGIEDQLRRQGAKYERFTAIIKEGMRKRVHCYKIRTECKLELGLCTFNIKPVVWAISDHHYGGVLSIDDFDRYFMDCVAFVEKTKK